MTAAAAIAAHNTTKVLHINMCISLFTSTNRWRTDAPLWRAVLARSRSRTHSVAAPLQDRSVAASSRLTHSAPLYDSRSGTCFENHPSSAV